MFDDEVLAAAGLEVVDEPSTIGGCSQEERLLQAMRANFQKLQALHRARLNKAKSRMAPMDKAEADLEECVARAEAWFRQAHKDLKAAQDALAERDLALVMKRADIEKAQELAKQEAAQAEAARHQQQAALNSQ